MHVKCFYTVQCLLNLPSLVKYTFFMTTIMTSFQSSRSYYQNAYILRCLFWNSTKYNNCIDIEILSTYDMFIVHLSEESLLRI